MTLISALLNVYFPPYLNFMAESLLQRAEQWNSWAPEPSRILCRFLSVMPPPAIQDNEKTKEYARVCQISQTCAKERTWHDDNSIFGLRNQGDKKTKGGMDHIHTIRAIWLSKNQLGQVWDNGSGHKPTGSLVHMQWTESAPWLFKQRSTAKI